MTSTQDERHGGPRIEAAVLIVAGVAIVLALIALDTDPVTTFWALTAGLPLVAFAAIAVVVLARRLLRPSEHADDR